MLSRQLDEYEEFNQYTDTLNVLIEALECLNNDYPDPIRTLQLAGQIVENGDKFINAIYSIHDSAWLYEDRVGC